MRDVVIVIPVYQQELQWYEQMSLARCFEVLGHYPIVFVAPEGVALDFGEAYREVPRVTFPARFFESVAGYNELMLSPSFYAKFSDFRKMLVYQLDAFVFSDQLMSFVAMDYDWIGAPWFRDARWNRWTSVFHSYSVVGNGGFCLRDVRSCLRVLAKYEMDRPVWKGIPEDWIFCHYFRSDPAFRLAPIRAAYAFSSEADAELVWYKNGGKLPFGCHAWMKMSADFYLWAFRQIGYDLRGARVFMGDKDLALQELFLRRWKERYLPEAERRADLPLEGEARWLRRELERKDVYAAAEAIFYAEVHLLNVRGVPQPDEVYMVEHLDALLYRGIADIEQGHPGDGIRYLKAWNRIAYRYDIPRWPELYSYIAKAYRALGREILAQHYEELQRDDETK